MIAHGTLTLIHFLLFLNKQSVAESIVANIADTENTESNQSVSSTFGVPCVPDASTSQDQIGFCSDVHLLNSFCDNMEMSTSKNCSSSMYCCFNPNVRLSTIRNSTSANGVYPAFKQSMAANIIKQQCGIPNGNPSIFTSVESAGNLFSSIRSKSFRETHTETSRMKKSHGIPHVSGGSDVPDGAGYECWQVSVINITPINGSFVHVAFCGGVIVGSRTILTAAHCVLGTNETVQQFNSSATSSRLTVTTGVVVRDLDPVLLTHAFVFPNVIANCSSNLKVVQTIPHPQYDSVLHENDIAILVLNSSIDFRQNSNCTCQLCLNRRIPKPGETCIVSGWGLESDSATANSSIALQYVPLEIVPPDYDICPASINANGQLTNLDLFLCAGNVFSQNSCAGDSGGPLFCYDSATDSQYLAGLVSFGVVGCPDGFPSMYTKVGKYLSWIFNNSPLGDVTIMT